MPIYEYACKPCGKVFEELIIRKADETEVRCPKCKSSSVSRLVSRPAPSKSAGGQTSSPASACGPIG